jgi:hypothetical protein
MKYFTQQEQDMMLKEGEEFDKKLTKVDYKKIVSDLEKKNHKRQNIEHRYIK